MCKPGGPRDDGELAERVPDEVQEAWYTGWKKIHGLKWQAISLRIPISRTSILFTGKSFWSDI